MKKTKEEYYQANPLVQAQKNYDIVEHRILRLAMADLNPRLKNSKYYDEQFPAFHLSTKEVFTQFQGDERNDHRIYEKIIRACENMMKSYVKIGNKNNFTLFPVFHRIRFNQKDGLILQFHEDMKPFLLNLYTGNYTRCYLQLAFDLSSKYSLILLELILQYRGVKKNRVIERRITPDELKFAFDIGDDAYKLMNNFIRRVINPAIKEINEKTNYYINPEYKIERGRYRKIHAFVFTLTLPATDMEGLPGSANQPQYEEEDLPALPAPVEETPSPAPPKSQEEQEKSLDDYSEEEIKALGILLKLKINLIRAQNLLDEYGTVSIGQVYADMQKDRKRHIIIENPAGYMINGLAKLGKAKGSLSLAEQILARAAAIRAREAEEERKKQEQNKKQRLKETAAFHDMLEKKKLTPDMRKQLEDFIANLESDSK